MVMTVTGYSNLPNCDTEMNDNCNLFAKQNPGILPVVIFTIIIANLDHRI